MLNKVENIVAKGEIPHHEQFHLCPQCFQKSSAAISSKCICRWERFKLSTVVVFCIVLPSKSGKHCDKRRNCTFCAISSFVTMFSKSRLLQPSCAVDILYVGMVLPFPTYRRFWCFYSRQFLKTLWQREKLQIMFPKLFNE